MWAVAWGRARILGWRQKFSHHLKIFSLIQCLPVGHAGGGAKGTAALAMTRPEGEGAGVEAGIWEEGIGTRGGTRR